MCRLPPASIGQQIVILNASSEHDIENAFASIVQQRAGAILVGPDPFFTDQRNQLVALAALHGVPAIYQWREFAEAGGLMSYGTSLTDAYRSVGIYVGRIFKGSKPADLPVQQSTKVELVINLKTAKSARAHLSAAALGPRRRGDRMNRREAITLLGGAAAWPLDAIAEQRIRRVGVLNNYVAGDRFYEAYFAAFVEALRNLGWTDGENLRVDIRWTAVDASTRADICCGTCRAIP